MSMAMAIQIRNLEARLDAAEDRIAALEQGERAGYRAKHRGGGVWDVVNVDGVRGVGHFANRAGAEAKAAELNAV